MRADRYRAPDCGRHGSAQAEDHRAGPPAGWQTILLDCIDRGASILAVLAPFTDYGGIPVFSTFPMAWAASFWAAVVTWT